MDLVDKQIRVIDSAFPASEMRPEIPPVEQDRIDIVPGVEAEISKLANG